MLFSKRDELVPEPAAEKKLVEEVEDQRAYKKGPDQVAEDAPPAPFNWNPEDARAQAREEDERQPATCQVGIDQRTHSDKGGDAFALLLLLHKLLDRSQQRLPLQ